MKMIFMMIPSSNIHFEMVHIISPCCTFLEHVCGYATAHFWQTPGLTSCQKVLTDRQLPKKEQSLHIVIGRSIWHKNGNTQ